MLKTEFHGPNYMRPPPDLIDGEEEYEVESILKSRRYGRGCKVQYLIKWRGYADSDNEWVNWDDVHADKALEEFKWCQPQAITHIRRAMLEAQDTTPQSMSSDALCAALPYANLEGPIPYNRPSNDATTGSGCPITETHDPNTTPTVGSGYLPTKAHRHAVTLR
jgi:hypothetical protein